MSPEHHGMSHKPGTPFERDPSGLPAASPSRPLHLDDGETIDLIACAVSMQIGAATVKMLGYDGSIPGPTLYVRQGSEVTVRFLNDTDQPTTVHWHGLRHDNRFDGVPEEHRGMQPPVAAGDTFSYRLRFPDPGVFWYHPHIREDYGQEQGLYGAIIVRPVEPAYWPQVDREACLILDDILIEDGLVGGFDTLGSDHTLMGRYGNVMLTNGDTHFTMRAGPGEVVRLYLINAANTRTIAFAIPGARVKQVGGDNGRMETEEFVDDVVLSPSERAVLDVLFDRPGVFAMEHHTPDHVYALGTIEVERVQPVASVTADQFWTSRQWGEFDGIRRYLDSDPTRPPDRSISLVGLMTGTMDHHGMNDHATDPIEWEDTMAAMNQASTPATMSWAIVDDDTGQQNMAIDWVFHVGDRVKIRITNSTSTDHPMQHPFHVHGQRFLVLSRNGVQTDNLVWKDTVLVPAGETVDILVEATNPGRWMAHCHIAEHLEGGMMFTFDVIADEALNPA
jgi:FtsP/CotA-like multicopper oxidase with cupredoxin domain